MAHSMEKFRALSGQNHCLELRREVVTGEGEVGLTGVEVVVETGQ